MGTDERPDSENECECLSMISRSRDSSLFIEDIVNGLNGDILVVPVLWNVQRNESRKPSYSKGEKRVGYSIDDVLSEISETSLLKPIFCYYGGLRRKTRT